MHWNRNKNEENTATTRYKQINMIDTYKELKKQLN